jgi:hypothetical protein
LALLLSSQFLLARVEQIPRFSQEFSQIISHNWYFAHPTSNIQL